MLFESLYSGPPMIMLLGAACPDSTRATAQIGGISNLLQVIYLIKVEYFSLHEISYGKMQNLNPSPAGYESDILVNKNNILRYILGLHLASW